MNLPGVEVDLPTFTEADLDAIVNFGVKYECDFIAASFVRKKSDIECLRRILTEHNASHIKVIAKIENEEGLRNYPEILAATDGIMYVAELFRCLRGVVVVCWLVAVVATTT